MHVSRMLAAAVICLMASASSLNAACAPPTCTKLIDNGPDGQKLVLVVMGDGYDAADQSKYNGDVKNLVIDGVFGNDFFRENQNAFNVYRLNLVSAQSGVSQRVYDEKGTHTDPSDDVIVSTTMKNTALKYIWSGSWAHCWLEGSAETGALVQNALTANVPNYTYVVVLLNQDNHGGCGGGGFQIVPRGVTWPVLAHEYGHGIGGLWDEYQGGGAWTGSAVTASPNCSTVTDKSKIFWRRFIHPGTPTPTTFGPGMDALNTNGAFEGCGTKDTGIFRPTLNSRMLSNTPPFNAPSYTWMKKALFPYLKHNFSDAYTGDFNGDGRSDVLIHNGADLAIYRASATPPTLSHVWTANNIVEGGSCTWQPAPGDQYFVGDFDGDGKDDVFVFNGVNWDKPYLGLLRADGTGLRCVARYDGAIPGFWTMRPGDKLLIGDFDGDRRADVAIFNGTDWSIPYLGLLKSQGASLSGIARYDATVPGWSMKPNDKFFVGDFDGDGRADLYVFNGADWSHKYLGMLRSSGTALANKKLFTDSLPGWSMRANDRFLVGDFDGDRKADLYVFNGSDWSHAYLLMAKSTGSDLAFVKRYDSSSSANNIPGWSLAKGDRFFVAEANKDGRADLFVYNPAVNWSTQYLGTLLSSGAALSGSWSQDWVGGWNLGPADKIMVANYEGGVGKADIFIRNDEWFGLIRRSPSGFVMDRIYHRWIYTAAYDAQPWSVTLP